MAFNLKATAPHAFYADLLVIPPTQTFMGPIQAQE